MPFKMASAICMTAATIRSELLQAIEAAKEAVEKNPRPETYRALLEAQSELQQHDLTYGRNRLLRERIRIHCWASYSGSTYGGLVLTLGYGIRDDEISPEPVELRSHVAHGGVHADNRVQLSKFPC